MIKRLASLALAGLFAVNASSTLAQSPETNASECSDCLSAEAAKEDLQTLYARLQEEHVNLFARRTREEYSAHFARLIASIDAPLTRPQFHLVVQDAMAFGQIGHAKTDAVIGDVVAHIQTGGTIIPLSITHRGGQMVTDNWAGPGDALPPGSKIKALGGLSLQEFEERLKPIISADTMRLMRSQMELLMPAALYSVFGPVDALQVDYIDPQGNAGSHSVSAMTLDAMYAMQDERALPTSDRDPSARVYRDLGNGVFYLQPGPFFTKEDERGEDGGDYEIGPFKAFVEEGFAALKESGATNLLLDFRNNPGGDSSFSDLIMARLVDRPYVFASRYVVRAGPSTKAGWADRNDDPDTLLGRISNAIERTEVGGLVMIDLPEVEPISDNAFGGKVWVLIDQHSYSNAAVVAGLMQDLDIATIVGEETADLATTYGAVERFSLPNSGAPIVYPKAYMVRVSGDEGVRGVVPDIAIDPNPIGASKDEMLEAAVALVAQKH